jgi:hypothetical protein
LYFGACQKLGSFLKDWIVWHLDTLGSNISRLLETLINLHCYSCTNSPISEQYLHSQKVHLLLTWKILLQDIQRKNFRSQMFKSNLFPLKETSDGTDPLIGKGPVIRMEKNVCLLMEKSCSKLWIILILGVLWNVVN